MEADALRRYALRDDQWDRIKHLLPGQEGWVGVTAADNRLFIEAVVYRYRAGIPWRDLPERFGDWKNVHRRHSRWAASGVWARVFEHLAGDADNEYGRRGVLPTSSPRRRRRGEPDLREVAGARQRPHESGR